MSSRSTDDISRIPWTGAFAAMSGVTGPSRFVPNSRETVISKIPASYQECSSKRKRPYVQANIPTHTNVSALLCFVPRSSQLPCSAPEAEDGTKWYVSLVFWIFLYSYSVDHQGAKCSGMFVSPGRALVSHPLLCSPNCSQTSIPHITEYLLLVQYIFAMSCDTVCDNHARNTTYHVTHICELNVGRRS